MTLLNINTPTASVVATGTPQAVPYVGNYKTHFISVANAGSTEAFVFSGLSNVTISGNNYSVVLPNNKEVFAISPNDTHCAIQGAGNVYVQRCNGE